MGFSWEEIRGLTRISLMNFGLNENPHRTELSALTRKGSAEDRESSSRKTKDGELE